MLAGLILRKLFSYNQENFTGGQSIIPTVVVIEEAQSVLGRNLDDTSPFVEWVKEGRKYELGAILVTQQPGSLAGEILSQSDNWFSFHLLSEGDAGILGKYNSHFSDDILAHLIGEPIPGNCFMWSAPKQPFVLPVRIRSFEELYGNRVKRGSSEASIQCALSQSIVKSCAEAIERLATALKIKINDSTSKVRFREIPSDSADKLYGIKGGQLYYLIKDIKEPSDTTPEDELKTLLLNHLLGEGVPKKLKHDSNDYFCATEQQWRDAGINCNPE